MPSDAAEPAARPVPTLVRIAWRIVLTLHAAAAGAWVWMMPGGFPVGHARWWANRALPGVVIAVCVVGVWAGWRRRDALLRHVALGVVAAWLAAAVAGRAIFPISGRLAWLPALAAAAVLGAMAGATWLGTRPRLAALAAVLAAAAVGASVPLSQRAGEPATRPLDVALPAAPTGPMDRLAALGVHPTDSVDVHPSTGLVRVRHGEMLVEVKPRLVFWSASPDRCWTILAPRRGRCAAAAALAGLFHDATSVRASYGEGATGALSVTVDPAAGSVSLEALRRLDEPVYSHLNAFCQVDIATTRRLWLSFSPCGDARVEVLPSDYPVGRPARLAYLGADGQFRVVEATSGEKGPFRELAAGPLRRDEALAITLHHGDEPACRIVLDDFVRQASTALSPTAGWGLPQNAIEFTRYGEADVALASVFITLAGTSVGRGWDSVGHAAGVYRNRLRIEPIAPASREGGDARPESPDEW